MTSSMRSSAVHLFLKSFSIWSTPFAAYGVSDWQKVEIYIYVLLGAALNILHIFLFISICLIWKYTWMTAPHSNMSYTIELKKQSDSVLSSALKLSSVSILLWIKCFLRLMNCIITPILYWVSTSLLFKYLGYHNEFIDAILV